ncbi:hypothetical protein PR048_011521, partial [Dryococelus australis]
MSKEHTCAQVFNSEYNLGFFTPIKDQCVFCKQYNNASHEEKLHLKEILSYNVSGCDPDIPEGRVHHTQIFCCRTHAECWGFYAFLYQKTKKRALKSGPVYVPLQWTGIVQCFKETGTHYHVREINFTEFHDFKTLSAEMGSNFTVDTNGDVVTWNDIHVLQVKKDHKYILFYKTDFESHDFKTINLRRRRRSRPLSEDFSLTPAYIT